MKNFEIVAQPESALANFLASKFNKSVINAEIKEFADSENYVFISEKEKIVDKDIFIVYQFTFGQEKINNQLFKLFLLADFIKKIGVNQIFVIIPYLPYSRQEKSFCNQYAGPIDFISNILKIVGINQIFTLDLHNQDINIFFNTKIFNINLNNFWADLLKNLIPLNKDKNNFCIVSPDQGRVINDKKIAQLLDLEFCYIEKKRIKADDSISLHLNGNVKNKTAIIIDDIIDTAKTATNSAQLLIKNGAYNVYGCFSHAIFANNALENILKSNFDKIFITNSINIDPKKFNSDKINLLSIDNLIFNKVKDFIDGKL